MNFLRTLLVASILVSCSSPEEEASLHLLVDPFIGTGGHGHTYPGATSPFGMVQLSPDTRLEGWDGCGGYHHSDSLIYGFSHTHLQGTGVSDYGDILFMPCTQFQAGKTKWNDRYASRFSHLQEDAHAGWYRVKLEDHDIDVELTTTPRVGIHRYEMNGQDTLTLIIDMAHRDEVTEYSIYPLDDRTLVGHRVSDNWAREQHVYFAAKFSAPFEWRDQLSEIRTEGVQENGSLKQIMEYVPVFAADFGVLDSLVVRTGLSFVDIEGALKNLEAEASHEQFNSYQKDNEARWDEQLSRLQVKGGSGDDRVNFYTSLYHSCTVPNVASDVDGRYRGTDLDVHQLAPDEGLHYTVFSLWDTFRSLHPLLNWIEPERTRDFARTFLRMYAQGGQLPVWELAANYTGCMIGYHSVPVLTDAWAWGIQEFDAPLALNAMIQAADSSHLGLPAYRELGYIPSEREHESVSKTLEYAFDDACIAEFGRRTGASEDVIQRFSERSCSWQNLFNPESNFIQPKRGGAFIDRFDPREVNFNYTEANGWQYTLFMPHDIETMIDLVGGEESFIAFLDSMFTSSPVTTGREQPDITGLIGQYAHGNEPSHHMAYLYTFAGRPDRTADVVDEILTTLYHPTPDGLSGNEDCGQMSAWYVWNAMGLYPVAPGSGQIIVGTPRFESVDVHPAGGGAIFSIHKSGSGHYVQELELNGESQDAAWIDVSQLVAGGELTFECGEVPSHEFGRTERPTSKVDCPTFVASPIIEAPRTFKSKVSVSLKHIDPLAKLHYRILPESNWTLYSGNFDVENGCIIEAFAANEHSSSVVQHQMVRVDNNWKLEWKQGEHSNQYHAGGEGALIDGIVGGPNFKTGEWQGFFDQNLVAQLDLGSSQEIISQSIGSLRDVRPWIMLPQAVRFYSSQDGIQWQLIEAMTHEESDVDEAALVKRFESLKSITARFLRMEMDGYGKLPSSHLGAGNPSWLFIDEWQIETR